MSHEEPHIIHALIDACFKAKITCLVQVGAEDGYEADEIRKATGCRAVAIEPDPKCGPVSPKIEFHEVVIGATNSIEAFYLNAVPGLSSLIPRVDGMELKADMPMYKLDTFCWKNDIIPDALIIDTEGTTLDVLEGCGALLDGVKLIYAECQSQEIRPGMRLLPTIDEFLLPKGFVRTMEKPTYSVGAQGNYLWVKP